MQAENGVILYILMNNCCLSLKDHRRSKYSQEMRNILLIDCGNLMGFFKNERQNKLDSRKYLSH